MKKYLLIMTLALLGGVTQVKAWGDMYLVCGENSDWSTSSNNDNFKFNCIAENSYMIYVPGSYVNSGIWYFRFRDKDSESWVNIGPASSTDDANVTDITVETNWQNSSKAFYVEQNDRAKWVKISIIYKQDSESNWKWHVSATYIEDSYTIGYTNPDNWGTVYVYAYDAQGGLCLGQWHGAEMTPNDGIYTAEVPQGCKVIFNDNGSNQYPASGGFDATGNNIFNLE